MPERAEILREMGLVPLWRLRRPGAPIDDDRSLPDTPSTTGERSGVDERLARIAMLDLDTMPADIDACTACPLCRTRRHTVTGVGDPHARWLFVGEAPGADEDARGEPFVGRAGRLLDNMLAALGLARDRDVYVTNVLKCRPPGNRTPVPLEVAACQPYLDRQIALIAPALIVALGKVAATTLLGVERPVGAMRGRLHRYRDIPMVVTYHPAYLLRSPIEKAKSWEDLLFARRKLSELAARGASTD